MFLRALHGSGVSHRQFINMFGSAEPDRQVEVAFVWEFVQRQPRVNGTIRGEQCCTCKRYLDTIILEGRDKGCVCSVPGITSTIISSSHIRGALIDIAFSLREMPDGKNLKQLEAQHRRMPRQVSSGLLPTPRQPSERVLLRPIYFLNSKRSKYVGLGFYPDRGYRTFFKFK